MDKAGCFGRHPREDIHGADQLLLGIAMTGITRPMDGKERSSLMEEPCLRNSHTSLTLCIGCSVISRIYRLNSMILTTRILQILRTADL